MIIRTVFLFLFSAYLFACRGFRPSTISNTLDIKRKQVMEWGLHPLWKPTLYIFGYRRKEEMRGIVEYRKQRPYMRKTARDLYHERLSRWTRNLIKISYEYDFYNAEKLWTEMFKSKRRQDFESDQLRSESKLPSSFEQFDVAEMHHE